MRPCNPARGAGGIRPIRLPRAASQWEHERATYAGCGPAVRLPRAAAQARTHGEGERAACAG
eukprot:1213733-Alexandrium_andersonii.AAC.1